MAVTSNSRLDPTIKLADLKLAVTEPSLSESLRTTVGVAVATGVAVGKGVAVGIGVADGMGVGVVKTARSEIPADENLPLVTT